MTDTGGIILNPELQPVGVTDSWGPSTRTVANPCLGAGNDILMISVVPGPASDVGGEVWIDPPGAGAPIIDSELAGTFVQRVRAWIVPEAGQPDFTFGYQTVSLLANTQTALAVCLSDRVDPASIRIGGPNVDNAIDTPYPGLTVETNWLVFALATGQNDDRLLVGPTNAGFAQLFDNTGGPPNRRVAALHWTNSPSTSLTTSVPTWSGSNAAHSMFSIGLHCAAPSISSRSPLPVADWDVYIDPDVRSTYDQNRSDCQLISVGERFNADGTTCSNLNGTGTICFDAAGEIHSFANEFDGDTLRLGARPADARLGNRTQMLVTRHQYRRDGSYNPNAETAGGQNPSTTFPGIDRTFFDGTRTQYAAIPINAADPKAIRMSLDTGLADTVIAAQTYQIQPWMLVSGLAAAGGGVHHQGQALSPWTSFIGSGQLRIITRDQAAGWAPGQPHPPGTTRAMVPITAADVGNFWTTILEYKVDPSAGFLRVWVDKQDGDGFTQIVDIGGFGVVYGAANENLNLVAYAILANYYNFHRVPSSFPPENWDLAGGNVRDMIYAYAGMKVNPTFTVDQVMDHAHYYTC